MFIVNEPGTYLCDFLEGGMSYMELTMSSAIWQVMVDHSNRNAAAD